MAEKTIATRQLEFKEVGSDRLYGKNVLGIVFRIEWSTWLKGGPLFAIVGETLSAGKRPVRLERVGRPEIKNISLSAKMFDTVNRDFEIRDIYNEEDAFNLSKHYVGAYRARLNANLAFYDVIAIENARLLNELRESLQQQTATADVLKIISSSAGELEPVFNAMLENAVQICDAKFGTMLRVEGDGYRVVAMHGAPLAYAKERHQNPVLRVGPTNPLARLARSRQLEHIADIRTDQAYLDRDLPFVQLADFAGARTLLSVPMLKEDNFVGAIVIYRQEVRPFTNKQAELVKNFAAQAVIAIENARLLNELRESLQQQTATADVLKVISTTTTDVIPVFEAILKSASRLCNSEQAVVFRFDGELLHLAATENWPTEALATYAKRYPTQPNPHLTVGRVVLTKSVVIQEDTLADVNYEHAVAQAGGWRRMLGVPMMHEGNVIGVIVLAWKEAGPVPPRYVELLQTFAAQAVIAIENVRLFKELRSRTHELTLSLDDLRNTQDRLVQTQKLALLGQLTAGIAHEIKNPLNFVNNFAGVSAEMIDELRDRPNYSRIKDRYKQRLEAAQFQYQEANGRIKGGVTVSDPLGARHSGLLFT